MRPWNLISIQSRCVSIRFILCSKTNMDIEFIRQWELYLSWFKSSENSAFLMSKRKFKIGNLTYHSACWKCNLAFHVLSWSFCQTSSRVIWNHKYLDFRRSSTVQGPQGSRSTAGKIISQLRISVTFNKKSSIPLKHFYIYMAIKIFTVHSFPSCIIAILHITVFSKPV